jgi:hypothetical protein
MVIKNLALNATSGTSMVPVGNKSAWEIRIFFLKSGRVYAMYLSPISYVDVYGISYQVTASLFASALVPSTFRIPSSLFLPKHKSSVPALFIVKPVDKLF